MRLPRTDDLLAKIPGWPYPQVTETLPDYAHIAELGGLGNLGRDLLRTQMTEHALTFTNAQIFQQSARIALGNIISGVGLPKGPIANSVLDILGNFDPLQSAEAWLKKMADSLIAAVEKMTMKVLSEAIDAGIGTAIDAAAIVPVVGWIVKICWDIGKLIYKLVQMVKHQDDVHFYYPPSRFSPAVDRDILNLMLAQLATSDWSTLFYPPSAGKNESWKQEIYIEELEGGGVRFVGGNGGVAGGTSPWLGFVPGTGWLHRAIETVGKIEKNKPVALEVGKTMLPSSQQQCLWLWNHVAHTNSPAAFTVHAETAADLWQVYIDDLREAIRSSKIDSGLKAAIFGMWDRQVTKSGKSYPIFGWGDGSKEREYSPTKILTTLRTRQLAFCKTLTVAYVDKSFAALADPVVAAAVDKYQRELLEHPAVCDVDLTSVPDELLADEIRSRRKHHNCLVYGGDKFAATTENPPPIVDGFAMPQDEPTGGVHARSGPSGVQVAGALTAVVGALSLLRR